jgi:hypothetical protein
VFSEACMHSSHVCAVHCAAAGQVFAFCKDRGLACADTLLAFDTQTAGIAATITILHAYYGIDITIRIVVRAITAKACMCTGRRIPLHGCCYSACTLRKIQRAC